MTSDALHGIDPVPISALNQFAYCPRRCYLIHVEQSFAENIHTLRGTAEHERADTSGHEHRGGGRLERALPVFSNALGLSGRCDVVEFWEDGTVYPVEYKHGKRRKWMNDDVQLVAQMLCLAEMLGKPVERGAIYHTLSRRRREVQLTDALKQTLHETLKALRLTLDLASAPPPTPHVERCDQCSLQDICQPSVFALDSPLGPQCATLFDDLADQDRAARPK